MREDVYVENDSSGFCLLSSAVVESAVADDRQHDAGFAARYEAVLLAQEGDDSFVARVVVNEPLTREESAQWICRVRTRLQVPCGRLLVCGGFDPNILAGFVAGRPGPELRAVSVPPGEYLVDVYTHLPTVNGRVLRERWKEKLGRWFRREHPGAAFPSWLASDLVRFPEDDPGHEKEWAKLEVSVASQKLRVDTTTLDWVGFVVHLQAPDAAAELTSPEDGWFATDCGFRRPERFPMGLPALGVQDPGVRDQLEALLPQRCEEEPELGSGPPPPESMAPVDDFLEEALPIDGGAVAVPRDRIGRVARIAWFCDRDVDALVAVTLPAGADWTPDVERDTPAIVVHEGRRIRIGFPAGEGSPASMLAWMADLGRGLGALPEGTVLEVCFADTGSPEVTSGNHRWRGTMSGDAWSVTDAWPAAGRRAVEQALALVEELERGKGIRARGAEEAAALVAAAAQDDFLSGIEVARRGLLLTLDKESRVYMPYLARVVFRTRHRDAWDLSSDEASRDELRSTVRQAKSAVTKAVTPALTRLLTAQATGKFERRDLGRWKGCDLERLLDFDARFGTLGLQPLGDVVFEFAPAVAVRAYGAAGGTVYAALLWPKMGEPQVDLYTSFSDESSVTTTTVAGLDDIGSAKAFRSSFPGAPVEVLWRRHEAAVARRLAAGCTALPAEPRIEAFARAVGEFFDRERAAAHD